MFSTISEMLGEAVRSGQAPPKLSAPPVDRPGERRFVRLDDLTLDRRLQQREEEFDAGQIGEIRDDLQRFSEEERAVPTKTGSDADALEVWNVGGVLYVVDGFQRHAAHRLEGFVYVECLMYTGTWREAYERSFVVNRHGKPLTPRDKRHKLLNAVEHWHEEVMSGRMSITELGRRTNLSPAFISKTLRGAGIDVGDAVVVTRGGQTYTMRTKNIGRPPKGGTGGGGGRSASAVSGASEGDGAATEEGSEQDEGHDSGKTPPDTYAEETSPQYPRAGQGGGREMGDNYAEGEDAEGDAVWGDPAAQPAPDAEDEIVLNVPVSLTGELRDLVLEHGSVRLQQALRNQLW